MKQGILEALRHTAATGQPPVPQRRPQANEPMQPIHEQLLASLQERNGSVPSTSTYSPILGTTPTPTGPPGQQAVQPLAPIGAARGPAHRRERDLQFDEARSRWDNALGRLRKGTIDQILGEPSDRAADGGGVAAGDRGAVVAPAAEAPGPTGIVCDRCDGKGVWQGRVCPECLGKKRVAGVVPVPALESPKEEPYAGPDHRDAPRGRDHPVGAVPLPLEPDPQVARPALTLRCPICEGRGFMRLGEKEVWCGRCGGEGYVADLLAQASRVHPSPEQVVASKIDLLDQTEQAWKDLQADGGLPEAQGPVPFDDTAAADLEEVLDGSITMVHDRPADGLADDGADVGVADTDRTESREAGDEGAGLADGLVSVTPEGAGEQVATPTLTYDLPTDPYRLPLFCYVCGPAGVGKTFQAKAWALHDPEGVVLAATTGIAAVNLGEGTTINSLLKFYDTASLTDAFTGGWLEAQLKRLRGAGLQRIVLDETSMLSGDQLTILTRAIDNVNADKGEDAPDLGLILIGDFAQLPPVKEPFAFESAEWPRYAEATYGLTTIRRQADQQFIEALQAVRRGDSRMALDYFSSMLQGTTNLHFQGTTILAKNDAVDKYNQLRLDKVNGKPLQFGSQRWGKLRPEWGGPPKPPQDWGVPEVLRLKEKALVMILANRNIAQKGEPPEYAYVNGDLGEVVGAEGGTATVVLQRTGEEVTVIPITRENLIPLEPGRRKALREEGHPERISANGKSEVIGACSYLPLRLAYGTTVHKSQGLSLDNVQVNIRDHFFRSPSMLYVALSRARTAEGLRLVGTPEGFQSRCSVDARVQPWL